jgi:DNA replication protein DnaC
MMRLIGCEWIARHQNIIITGPTGVGKTFLACALANKACREGYRSFYIRSPRFSQQLALARGDGIRQDNGETRQGPRTRYIRSRPFSHDGHGKKGSLEVIEERHGHASTIITSQLPVDHWHEQIGDPTIADAILDLLVHNTHKITLKGGSLRKKYAALT